METVLKIGLIGAGGFGDHAPCAAASDLQPFGIAEFGAGSEI